MRWLERIKFKEQLSKYSAKTSLFKDELYCILEKNDLLWLFDTLKNPSPDFSIFVAGYGNNVDFLIKYFSYNYFYIVRRGDFFNSSTIVYEFLNNKEEMKTRKYSKDDIETGLSSLEVGCICFDKHGKSDNKYFYLENILL